MMSIDNFIQEARIVEPDVKQAAIIAKNISQLPGSFKKINRVCFGISEMKEIEYEVFSSSPQVGRVASFNNNLLEEAYLIEDLIGKPEYLRVIEQYLDE